MQNMSATETPQRITIAFSNKRKPLERVLREEHKAHPKANAKLTGSPGNWKVRRDIQEGENPATHRACDFSRPL